MRPNKTKDGNYRTMKDFKRDASSFGWIFNERRQMKRILSTPMRKVNDFP